MFSDLLQGDRERSGLTIGQAPRRLRVSPVAYRKLEAGDRWPSWETYDRIAFGWPPSASDVDELSAIRPLSAVEMKVYCAHGHPVAPGTKFCPECGSDIEKYGMSQDERDAEQQRLKKQPTASNQNVKLSNQPHAGHCRVSAQRP